MKTISTLVFALTLLSPAVFAAVPNYGFHYIAEVESRDASSVTVKFLDKGNKPVTRVKFEPMADQTVMMDKKSVKHSSLRRGEKIDIWIEHRKWGLYASPDGSAMKINSVERL
jgi:hypothetical protein